VTNKQSMENMRFLFQHKKITIEEFRDYIDSEMLLNPEWASGIYKDPETHKICSSKKRSK